MYLKLFNTRKMASSLKNVSMLLSPKFLSPLSPSRNLVNVSKSDEKVYFLQGISRSNVVKKLDFSPGTKNPSSLPKRNLIHSPRVPDIKIDSPVDIAQVIQCQNTTSNSNILDINTPIKLDLVKNGLEKFKHRTTVLGKGTFGTVFKGRHKEKTVAVKIVTKESCSREQNALGLSHRNIVQTIEIIHNSDHQKYSLIIMEFLPNCKTLQEVLDHFQMEHSSRENSAVPLRRFALDITTGLNYMHINGIIHLDLKPRNILVDNNNVCKLCDFGNSAKISDNFDNFKHNGTIIYTAPEILIGKAPTIKSDIYSLGLVFWQIRHQKNPFQEYETMESIIYNVGKHDVRPACKSEKSDPIDAIFTKCWDSNPILRPNTEEILSDLKNV